MWERLGGKGALVRHAWPSADAAAAKEDEVELAVQVNGKVRGRITVPAEASDEEVRRLALDEPRVREQIAGKEILKVVVIPNRLVSVAAR